LMLTPFVIALAYANCVAAACVWPYAPFIRRIPCSGKFLLVRRIEDDEYTAGGST